jgi:hypothetical protein
MLRCVNTCGREILEEGMPNGSSVLMSIPGIHSISTGIEWHYLPIIGSIEAMTGAKVVTLPRLPIKWWIGVPK